MQPSDPISFPALKRRPSEETVTSCRMLIRASFMLQVDAEQHPLFHPRRVEFPVKPDRGRVPVEHHPFHPSAPPPFRFEEAFPEERVADFLLAEFREDKEVFQVERGAGPEGGVRFEDDRVARRLTVREREKRVEAISLPERVPQEARLRRATGALQLFVVGERVDEREKGLAVRAAQGANDGPVHAGSRRGASFDGVRRSNPGHFMTGNLGYLGNEGSLFDRPHRIKPGPFALPVRRAWTQEAQRPCLICELFLRSSAGFILSEANVLRMTIALRATTTGFSGRPWPLRAARPLS